MIHPVLQEKLRSQYFLIKEIISGLPESKIGWRKEEGKWNIHEQIAHLVQYQPVFLERIQKITEGNTPAFERYNANNDAAFEFRKQLSIQTLLIQLELDRTKILDFISGLEAADLKKTGVHPKFGTLTLVQWIEFFVLHEAHHIFSIFQLAHE